MKWDTGKQFQVSHWVELYLLQSAIHYSSRIWPELRHIGLLEYEDSTLVFYCWNEK